jgi:integrase
VTLNGKDHYLGRHGTAESKDEYDRLIAEWLAGGRRLPEKDQPEVTASEAEPEATPPRGPTVAEIILAYWQHAATYYWGPDGKPTEELNNLRDAVRPVRKLYGHTPAGRFGPLALRAVRDDMIRSGLARTTINAWVHRIRRCFRWAVSREKIPASVIQALDTVEALEPGRSEATETDPVQPVSVEQVEATLPHLNRVVAAMVKVQLLTGCRAGEVMIMRGCDLTPGEPNWEYRPAHHKTAWRGKKRVVILGPRAQEIVQQFLKPDTQAYLFDPRDVVADYHARRRSKRKSKPTPSEIAKRCKGKPGQGRSPRYDRRSYRQAVVRACDRAFPHPTLAAIKRKDLTADQRRELEKWKREHRWSPLQIRHTVGTKVRAKYGLEAAQLALGHARADVTEIYAQRDLAKAHVIASEIG